MGPLLAALVLAAALCFWLFRPRHRPEAEPWEEDAVNAPDRLQLDKAEREVRGRAAGRQPDDEEPGDDWGPGTPR